MRSRKKREKKIPAPDSRKEKDKPHLKDFHIFFTAVFTAVFTDRVSKIHQVFTLWPGQPEHCNQGEKPLQGFGSAAPNMQMVWGAQPCKVQRVRGAQPLGMRAVRGAVPPGYIQGVWRAAPPGVA